MNDEHDLNIVHQVAEYSAEPSSDEEAEKHGIDDDSPGN